MKIFTRKNKNNDFDEEMIKTLEEFTYKEHAKSDNKTVALHQIFPSYYLKVIQPEQKGLLINHYMGTGKTMTGIQMMYTFHDKPKILLIPKVLNSVWVNTIKELGFNKKMEEHGLGKYEFVYYENIISFLTESSKDFSDHVLIMDEGHHMVELIKGDMNNATILKTMSALRKFHKILLMTGTPFFLNQYDIIYLINIVSGQSVLPYSIEEFRKKYFYTNKASAFFSGYFSPIFTSNLPLYTGLAFYGTYMGDIINQAIFIFNNMAPITNKPENSGMIYQTINNAGYGLPFLRSSIEKASYLALSLDPMSMATVVSYLALFNLSLASAGALGILILPFLPIMLAVFLSAFCYLNRLQVLSDIKMLNMSKLSKDISKYISYYEKPKEEFGYVHKIITYTSNGFRSNNSLCYSNTYDTIADKHKKTCCKYYKNRLENGNHFYPEIKINESRIVYNAEQASIFLKMTYNVLSKDESYKLNLSSIKSLKGELDEELIELEKEMFRNVNTFEQFKDKGRIIGNLGVTPPKFVSILSIIGDEQAVIYSNFYNEGILLFEEFIKLQNEKQAEELKNEYDHENVEDKKITYSILHKDLSPPEISSILNSFKNRKIQLILLHPDYTEGISILEARHLHILEPPLNYSTYEQVIARVVRFKSHVMLPPEKRRVKIFLWNANVSAMIYDLFKLNIGLKYIKDQPSVNNPSVFFSMIQHMGRKFKKYAEYSPETIYWARLNKFNQDVTPDNLVLQDLMKIKKTIQEFQKNISKISIENCVKSENCPTMLNSINKINKTIKMKKETYKEEKYDKSLPYRKCKTRTIHQI
jgi:hypothetical protein